MMAVHTSRRRSHSRDRRGRRHHNTSCRLVVRNCDRGLAPQLFELFFQLAIAGSVTCANGLAETSVVRDRHPNRFYKIWEIVIGIYMFR